MSNSILPAAGNLDIVNANVRADKFNAATNIGVANTNPDFNFSVGDKFHVNKDSTDPVSITGNVVASGIKISNLTIGPAFDFASVSNVGNVTANVIQFANATTGFTTTANVEIGGNISLTSNAQVKVGSNVLAEYTGPHGRDPTTPLLKKYPEIAFEEGTFDSNPTTNTVVQAGYTITSSGNYSDDVNSQFTAWRAFTGKLNLYNPGWVSPFASYTSGVANSTQSLTNIDTATSTGSVSSRNGAWIKLELPTKIKLGRVDFYDRYDDSGTHTSSGHERVSEAFVYGGNSNSGPWYEIGKQSDATNMAHYTDDNPASLTINTTSYYKYYIIQPTQLAKTLAYGSYGQLMFYGTEEPAPPGDLSLDTTLKSTFNSVRSNNYVMYFDGEDPTGDPVVPKYLPSGTVKTITPNNITFDATNNCWSLDGSTESNVTTADLGFEGDVPHTVSMWVNASNLEANALTQQLFSIGSGYDKALVRVDDTQIAANTWHNVTYAYQGEGGSKVTYVDGRKVEEAQVEDTFGEYPPFAMTDYKTGGYCVSASDTFQEYSSYLAFNKVVNTTGDYWFAGDDVIGTTDGYTGSVGGDHSYIGTDSLGGYTGIWLKLEMPYKLALSYVEFYQVNGSMVYTPRDFFVIGSNDDITWDLIHRETSTAADSTFTSGRSITTTSANNYNKYKYIAIVVDRTVNDNRMGIGELKFYGHKEGDLTRFPEPTRVLKYPHVSIPSSYTKRGYVVSASSDQYVYGANNIEARGAWAAFGNTGSEPGWQLYYASGQEPYDSTADGSGFYQNNNLAPTLAGTSHRGHWIKLELPHKLMVQKMKTDHGSEPERLGQVILLGSNNDSDWYTIKDTFALTSASAQTTDINATVAYKYIVLIVKSLQNASINVDLKNLEYYGTQENTGTPAIVGGPFAGKVANFRVYDKYLGEERIQEIYDAQKDEFGHKKSSMTFYKGRIGVGTTEPEGALTVVDEPHALEKFPARAVSADDSYVEGEGETVIRTADGSGYQAFDGLTSTSWTATPTRNTRLSEEVDFGAWLKLQTPQSISLKKAEIESKPDWVQVGGEILTTNADEHFGRAVACSHDGTRIIAGGHVHSGNQGLARVYDWNGSAWEKTTNTLIGTADNDKFGSYVAISGDGNIIAVAAPFEHSNGADSGTVRVYYLNGSTWTILPDSGSLTGDTTSGFPDVFLGSAVNSFLGNGTLKLSYDGKTIAMCEYGYDISGKNDVGRVLVYKYSDGAWSYKGTGATQFVGDTADAHFGFGMSMSEDGDHLALGTRDAGYFIEVYNWDGSSWNIKGLRLSESGLIGNDDYGTAISISNDGNTLAVGARNADLADGARGAQSGLVFVYHWTGSAWGTPHKLQYDEATDEDFGNSVELSGDGKRLIVGASAENSSSGELFTFEYTGTSWIRRTAGVIGANGGSTGHLGYGPDGDAHSVAISRDGSTIVGGELGYDSPLSNSGRVRVWNMPSNIKSIWGSNDDVNWTKITTAPTREEATSNVAGLAFGYDDRLEFKNLDNPNYYKYHAIVADAFTRLKDVKLFGVRKQGSSTLHDGALTLTKNLEVPRIGPALDADDTPRRDRLVVEYNTSTNPVEDGVVRDTSGRGLDGVFYGGASYSAVEKALVFDGDADYVESPPLGWSGAQQHSVSVWIKLDQMVNPNSTSIQNAWTIVNGGATNRVSHLHIFTNGTIEWAFNGNNAATGTGQIQAGSWYHIVCVYNGGAGNGATSRRMWINGDEKSWNSIGSSDALNLEPEATFALGYNKQLNNYDHDGSISNAKLYDTALTAEEVKTLYDMGRCDEGHHVVNFSKTRVGIGLGDGQAPTAALDVRGENVVFNPQYESGTSSGRVGIGTSSPNSAFNFHQGTTTGGGAVPFGHSFSMTAYNPTGTVENVFSLYINNNNDLILGYGYNYDGNLSGTVGYFTDQNTDVKLNNFTGQHRTFIKDVPFSQVGELEGLIVSSDQNKYIKMSGGIEAGSNAITTNESLPIVSLSATASDKRCFGVISASEDPEERSDAFGSFVTPYEKEKGDTRVYINSVGEGAIWVSNIGGNLESGDYITTSNVAGYGQKQDSDSLKNYTVAKITMDCDFNPATQPVQVIKKDETGENVLDEHGQIQWEDHPTDTEKTYKIRYLDTSGVNTDEANAVHIAAFVGCTYHCG